MAFVDPVDEDEGAEEFELVELVVVVVVERTLGCLSVLFKNGLGKLSSSFKSYSGGGGGGGGGCDVGGISLPLLSSLGARELSLELLFEGRRCG